MAMTQDQLDALKAASVPQPLSSQDIAGINSQAAGIYAPYNNAVNQWGTSQQNLTNQQAGVTSQQIQQGIQSSLGQLQQSYSPQAAYSFSGAQAAGNALLNQQGQQSLNLNQIQQQINDANIAMQQQGYLQTNNTNQQNYAQQQEANMINQRQNVANANLAQYQQQLALNQLSPIDLGNQIDLVDQNGNVVSSLQKGVTPGSTTTTGSSSLANIPSLPTTPTQSSTPPSSSTSSSQSSTPTYASASEQLNPNEINTLFNQFKLPENVTYNGNQVTFHLNGYSYTREALTDNLVRQLSNSSNVDRQAPLWQSIYKQVLNEFNPQKHQGSGLSSLMNTSGFQAV